jgi:hypothetical protein
MRFFLLLLADPYEYTFYRGPRAGFPAMCVVS